jgi:hypothetical protein
MDHIGLDDDSANSTHEAKHHLKRSNKYQQKKTLVMLTYNSSFLGAILQFDYLHVVVNMENNQISKNMWT